MAFSYTPTTQVAVVCLVKKKFYLRSPETARLWSCCDAVCLYVWLFVPMCPVTRVLSCSFAMWFTEVEFSQGKINNHHTTIIKVVELKVCM